MNFYVFVVLYDIITLMIISNLMILIKNLHMYDFIKLTKIFFFKL